MEQLPTKTAFDDVLWIIEECYRSNNLFGGQDPVHRFKSELYDASGVILTPIIWSWRELTWRRGVRDRARG